MRPFATENLTTIKLQISDRTRSAAKISELTALSTPFGKHCSLKEI